MGLVDTVREIRKKRKKKKSYGDHSTMESSGDTDSGTSDQGSNPGG